MPARLVHGVPACPTRAVPARPKLASVAALAGFLSERTAADRTTTRRKTEFTTTSMRSGSVSSYFFVLRVR